MAAAAATAAGGCRLGGRPYDRSSVDSQFADDDDDSELTVLDACVDCDDEGLYELIQDGVTVDQVNERDKSGRVINDTLVLLLQRRSPMTPKNSVLPVESGVKVGTCK